MFNCIIKIGDKMDSPRYITDKPTIKKRLMDLSQTTISIFSSEPAMLRINDESIMIVGDIHGDLNSLKIVLEQKEKLDCKNILFLGDYVDRGSQGAEVLLALYDLKVADPDHVFLLRGNHEDEHINRYYGFYDEIGHDTKFIMRMQSIFQTMPVAAVLSNDIFCVHGGINGVDSIDEISKAGSYQYLWNDPSDIPGIRKSQRGPNIQEFGPNVVNDFLAANGLTRIIRAHEFQEDGYRWWFGGKLLSLFSSLNYCGRRNNGAFGIYEDGKLTLYIFNGE
jgi:diadenosine tetraphosphatase ApaH/serine/threonine PP2A family protein phosphatase